MRREADAETADRFLVATDRSFAKLAETPGLGGPVTTRSDKLADVQKWRVEGFPKLLIFYQPIRDGVRVIRLFHAAQDWMAHLEVDNG